MGVDLHTLAKPGKARTALLWLLAVLLLLGLAVVMAPVLPEGIDWHLAFRPAARAVLAGQSPFSVEGYFNAPWAILPLLPLALLPESVGRAMLFLVSLLGYTFVAHRLGAAKIALAAFLLSPPVMHGLLNANIDWLAMLGFVLPPQLGLFFVVIKPQIGVGVAVFWLIEAWRVGRLYEVVRVFGPVAVCLGLSFLMFGLWPLRFGQEVSLWWNASLWPMSIPVGLALLVAAARQRRIEFAMGAGPCLSPYVLLHSWAAALAGLLSRPAETVAAVVGLWILVILRAGAM